MVDDAIREMRESQNKFPTFCAYCHKIRLTPDEVITLNVGDRGIDFCDAGCRDQYAVYCKVEFREKVDELIKTGPTSPEALQKGLRDLLLDFEEAWSELQTSEDKYFVNLTPHDVVLNDGREYPASGTVARVSMEWTQPHEDIATFSYGQIENLPRYDENSRVMYIVSLVVLQALDGSRDDCVAPASGHPDTRRDERGQIVSVPFFCQQEGLG